jgi:hypothetical protein
MQTLVCVAALIAGLVGCESRSPAQQFCELATAIANDPDKRSHLKKWIVAHLEDEKFRESLRDFSSLRGDEERMQDFGAVERQLGIAEGTSSLEFHGALERSGKFDASRINAVELSVGRSSIFVRLSPEFYARQTWSPESLAAMKAFDDDVFVYCDMES